MSQDPYALCFCGSGKKHKFCCQDVLTDLQRITHLLENQPEVGLRQLEELYRRNPDKESLVTQLAGILSPRGQAHRSRELLIEFLRRHPDEPRPLLLLAEHCVSMDGFEKSRRLAHRAFQVGARPERDGKLSQAHRLAALAARVAEQQLRAGKVLSAREHLTLGIRYAEGDFRNELVSRLTRFESERDVAWPMRGRLTLMPVELEGDEGQQELRARKLCRLGCFEPAAIVARRLCEAHPKNGALAFNLGLYSAWDGRHKDAVESLHKAARLLAESDPDAAVSAETIAQVLASDDSEDRFATQSTTVAVTSVTAAADRLREGDLLGEIEQLPGDDQDNQDRPFIQAEFEYTREPADQELPELIAEVVVRRSEPAEGDDRPDCAGSVEIVSLEAEHEEAVAKIRAALGDLQPAPDEPLLPKVIYTRPGMWLQFDWRFSSVGRPSEFAMRQSNIIRMERELDRWIQAPHPGLDDRTPAEVAESTDPVDRVRLEAVLLLLDTITTRQNLLLPMEELRSRLKLSEFSPLELGADESVISQPLLNYIRLRPEQLSDRQLIEYVNRTVVIYHPWLIERGITELMKRPDAMETLGLTRAHSIHASICRLHNRIEDAADALSKARESVPDRSDAFRERMEFDIRELSVRLDNPEADGIETVVNRIRDTYFRKIPQIEELVREELTRAGRPDLLPAGTA